MIKKIISFQILIFTLCCCTNPKKAKECNKKSITIIFKANANSEKITLGEMTYGMYSFIKYIDSDSCIEVLNAPRYMIKSDTIEIKTGKDLAVFYSYKYQPYNFFFQAGDSIEVDSENDKLFCTVKNRIVNKYDLNFNYYFYSNIPDAIKLSAYYCLDKSRLAKDDKSRSHILSQEISQVQNFYNRKLLFLDSIYKRNEITPIVYHKYKNTIIIGLQNFLAETKSYGIPVKEITDSIEPNDSLIIYGEYRSLVRQRIESKVKTFTYSNGSYIDSREAFQKVLNTSIYKGRTRDYLLTRYLGMINENFPSEYLQYIDLYKKIITNDLLLHNANINKDQFLKEMQIGKDSATLLLSSNGSKTSLPKLIDSLKGKGVADLPHTFDLENC